MEEDSNDAEMIIEDFQHNQSRNNRQKKVELDQN